MKCRKGCRARVLLLLCYAYTCINVIFNRLYCLFFFFLTRDFDTSKKKKKIKIDVKFIIVCIDAQIISHKKRINKKTVGGRRVRTDGRTYCRGLLTKRKGVKKKKKTLQRELDRNRRYS